MAAARQRLATRHPQAPTVLEQCTPGLRPCPWVGCVHHLVLRVTRSGSIRTHGATLELARGRLPRDPAFDDHVLSLLDTMPETCDLDVANYCGRTYTQIGKYLFVTRQQVAYIGKNALLRARRRAERTQ